MSMLNKVQIIGRLGADPEIRHTQQGKLVANFNVGVGNSKQGTEWFRVVAWEKTGEVAQNYLKKGHLAYVEGRLETREWEDNQGNKRQTPELIAMNIQVLTPKDNNQQLGHKDNVPSGDGWGSF